MIQILKQFSIQLNTQISVMLENTKKSCGWLMHLDELAREIGKFSN